MQLPLTFCVLAMLPILKTNVQLKNKFDMKVEVTITDDAGNIRQYVVMFNVIFSERSRIQSRFPKHYCIKIHLKKVDLNLVFGRHNF